MALDRRGFIKVAIITPFALSFLPELLAGDVNEYFYGASSNVRVCKDELFAYASPARLSELAGIKLFSFAPVSKRVFMGNYPFKSHLPEIIQLNDNLSLKKAVLESRLARILVIGSTTPEKDFYMAEALADLAEDASLKFFLTPYEMNANNLINVVYGQQQDFSSAFARFITFVVASEYPGIICYGFSDFEYICSKEKRLILFSLPSEKNKGIHELLKEYLLDNSRTIYAKSGICLFFFHERPDVNEIAEARDAFYRYISDEYFFYCYILPTPYFLLGLMSDL